MNLGYYMTGKAFKAAVTKDAMTAAKFLRVAIARFHAGDEQGFDRAWDRAFDHTRRIMKAVVLRRLAGHTVPSDIMSAINHLVWSLTHAGERMPSTRRVV